MVFENAALATVNYAALALLLLGFGFLLRHYFNYYHRPYLRFWSYASWYFGASAVFAATRSYALGSQLIAPASTTLNLIIFLQLSLTYISLALLCFGVFDIMREQAPRQSRRRAVYAGAVLFAGAGWALQGLMPQAPWVVALRDTLMFLISGMVLLSIGVIVLYQGRKSIGPRLISVAFVLLGLKNIALVHASLLSANMALSEFVWSLQGIFTLVFISIAAGGIIIWLLESERHRSFKAQQHAAYLNTHDALTGMENREELVKKLPSLIEHSRTRQRHLTLMVIGLNRFKAINDSLGIRGGDRVLIEVSKRLQRLRPAPLTVARISGDVFIVAFDHLKKRSLVEQLGRSIQQRIQDDMLMDSKTVKLSCAVGIARFPQNSVYADTLLSKANIALSQAKGSNSDSVVFYQRGMGADYIRLIDMEPELRQALDNDEFILHLQPVYTGSSKRLSSFEALIRWQHPSRGLLPPSEFLPFIEDLGWSIELDDWVLAKTAHILSTWRRQGLNTLPIAVNICARHFQNPDLISKLKQLFSRYQLSYQDIELEITENVAMTDIQAGLNVLAQLRELGIRVSIDDFGTGYSSLAYLRRLPVDKIKIDRSFISELLRDAHNSENVIVRSLIELSHGLRKRVVAEGVETQEQLNLLNGMRCDQVQGYLLSPPVNIQLAAELLTHHWQQRDQRAHGNLRLITP